MDERKAAQLSAAQLCDEAYALARKLTWSLWADASDPRVQRVRLILFRVNDRLTRRFHKWATLSEMYQEAYR